jgi:hypothetical protein
MTTVSQDGWIVMRSRVSLAGRVTAAGGEPAKGGALSLTAVRGATRNDSMPPPSDVGRRYETRILGDGFYFFLDLPVGHYVLTGHDEDGSQIEGLQISIRPTDGPGPQEVNVSASRTSGAEEPPPGTKTAAAPPRRQRAPRKGGRDR